MRVLVVDDNQSITRMLEKYLKLKNYDVTICNDGRNGLNMIQNQKFDTVLVDLAMPEFTGIDLIDILEKEGRLKDNRIFILTASSVNSTQSDELKKKGVIACLKKPVRMPELLQAISA